jgi:hypothetical protein
VVEGRIITAPLLSFAGNLLEQSAVPGKGSRTLLEKYSFIRHAALREGVSGSLMPSFPAPVLEAAPLEKNRQV